MRRVRSSAAVFGLSAIVLVVLALSVPVSGGAGAPTGGAGASPEVLSAPMPVGAQDPVLGLPGVTSPMVSANEVCAADTSDGQVSDGTSWSRGRTCRCSCGAPCKTDADCGGGVGSCRPGITCC